VPTSGCKTAGDPYMVKSIANFAGAGSESGLHMPDPSEGPSSKQGSCHGSTALPPLTALEPLLFPAAALLRKIAGFLTQFIRLRPWGAASRGETPGLLIAWTQPVAVAGMPSCNQDS
jgi:hypothetical protein